MPVCIGQKVEGLTIVFESQMGEWGGDKLGVKALCK